MTDSVATSRADTLAYAPGGLAAPHLDRLPAGTRLWFGAFVLWMAGWALLAVWMLEWTDAAVPGAARLWIAALMVFYLSLCNSFLPAPTAWIVLLAASPEFALLENPWQNVVLVSLLATLGTVAANLNEYHLLSYVLHFGWGRRVRRTRVYGWALRWFDRAPFQLLMLIAFVPIPVDAVRWVAVLRRYSRWHYALAYFGGRGLRYVIFATCSTLLALTGWQILGIQVGLLAVALVGRVAWWRVRACWGQPREAGHG